MTTNISVVCIQEEGDDLYTAQCVEYDLSAQGTTPDEALDAFMELIDARIAWATAMGVGTFEDVPPPPADLVEWILEQELVSEEIQSRVRQNQQYLN